MKYYSLDTDEDNGTEEDEPILSNEKAEEE